MIDAKKIIKKDERWKDSTMKFAKNFTDFVDWYAQHWGTHEANQRTGDLFSGNNK